MFAFGTVAVVVLALVAMSMSPMVSTAAAADGKQVFEAQKCSLCHDVSTVGIEAKMKSEKMKGPDLVNIADQHDAAWVAKYLAKKENLNGAPHKKEFTGTDEELQALVDWILAQKK